MIGDVSYEFPQNIWFAITVLHGPIQVRLDTSTYTNKSILATQQHKTR